MFDLLICVIFYTVFNSCLINAQIPSESMEPTIMVGDRIFGSTLAYVGDNSPDRYDIIIFKDPTRSGKLLIKRVIGLPGETVLFKDGDVYINDYDHEVDDSFCMEQDVTTTGGLQVDAVYIPSGKYFVMGDNRMNSLDSRYWVNEKGDNIPYVDDSDIVARASFRYFPFSKIGPVL